MATVTKTFCDNCGAEKQQTNHWYRLHYVGGIIGLAVIGFDERVPEGTLVAPAEESHNRTLSFHHCADACSQRCVLHIVSRFLDTRKVEKTEK